VPDDRGKGSGMSFTPSPSKGGGGEITTPTLTISISAENPEKPPNQVLIDQRQIKLPAADDK